MELGRQHDSSVRAMAADILLQNKPNEELIRSVMEIMSSQSTKELNTLLLGRLRDLASKDDNLLKVRMIIFVALTLTLLYTSVACTYLSMLRYLFPTGSSPQGNSHSICTRDFHRHTSQTVTVKDR